MSTPTFRKLCFKAHVMGVYCCQPGTNTYSVAAVIKLKRQPKKWFVIIKYINYVMKLLLLLFVFNPFNFVSKKVIVAFLKS